MAKNRELHFSKRRRRIDGQIVMEIVEYIFEIIIVVAMAYVLVAFFGTRSEAVGTAMQPTVCAGDQILVNKFSCIVSHPKAGDVVLFLPNGNEKSYYYIRRVVALPGDTVRIENGILYVNGEPYEETTNVEQMAEAGIAENEIKLKSGEYFVLGDNRNNSEDSRYANIGVVREEYIIGKAWFRFTSLRDFGFVK